VSNNELSLERVVAQIRQWLAEGKDVRLSPAPARVAGFPMIEMRDTTTVEVVTRAGATR